MITKSLFDYNCVVHLFIFVLVFIVQRRFKYTDVRYKRVRYNGLRLIIERIPSVFSGPYNDQASEFDFKKALDLLSLLEPGPATDDLRLQIWCSAILRNSWKGIDVHDPLEANRDTMFFKTVELAYAEGESSVCLISNENI